MVFKSTGTNATKPLNNSPRPNVHRPSFDSFGKIENRHRIFYNFWMNRRGGRKIKSMDLYRCMNSFRFKIIFKSHSSVLWSLRCFGVTRWIENFHYWMYCDGWQWLWWSESRTHKARHWSGIRSLLLLLSVMISISDVFTNAREKRTSNFNRKKNRFRCTLNAKCRTSRAVWVRVCVAWNFSCDKWIRLIIISELWLNILKMTNAVNNSALTFSIMRP